MPFGIRAFINASCALGAFLGWLHLTASERERESESESASPPPETSSKPKLYTLKPDP